MRAKNWRQKKEAHLLDVRVRPHVSRRIAANHSARWVIGTICLVGIFAGLFWGVLFAANHLFLRNARYSVKELRVETDGTLTRSQILELAKVTDGANLFAVNLSQVRGRLMDRARIAEAEVRRQLPDTLIIRVKERIPVAWVAPVADLGATALPAAGAESVPAPAMQPASDESAAPAVAANPNASPHPPRSNAILTDADGLLLETDSLTAGYVSLPLIRIPGPSKLEPGTRLEDEALRDSLELLGYLREEILSSPFQVEMIDGTVGYCLVVENRLGSQITFSRKNMRDQVKHLNRLLAYSDSQGRQLASANLMAHRNLPITFFPDGYQPPVSPTPVSLSDGIPVRRALPAHPEAQSMP